MLQKVAASLRNYFDGSTKLLSDLYLHGKNAVFAEKFKILDIDKKKNNLVELLK